MNIRQRLGVLRGQAGAGESCRAAPDGSRPVESHALPSGRRLPGRAMAAGLHVLDETVPGQGLGTFDGLALPELQGVACRDWVYLDTETTGLSGGSGNLAFMVGVARVTGEGDIRLRQYLLSGFGGERALLEDMASWLGDVAGLVSYNGKSFDMPLLSARCRLNRLPDAIAGRAHLDLLYTVRRAFSARWSDCRLQTAERRLLGLQRQDDLPGYMAPKAWQQWLRNADPGPLVGVLRHNRQDVLSLCALHARLVALYQRTDRVDADRARMARAWVKAGCQDAALDLLRDTRNATHDERLLLADIQRRRGQWRQAEGVWQALADEGCEQALEALSKYYEHRRRDYRAALRVALQLGGSDAEHRCARIRRKCGPNMFLPLLSGGRE